MKLIHEFNQEKGGRMNNLDTRAGFSKILRGICKDFGIPWEEQERKLIKTYDYMDQEGKLVFLVCQYDPKDFKQRRPDEELF